MEEIRERVAIVTGASSGIGAATASALAQRGAHVVLTARRADRLEERAKEITDRYAVQALVLPADVTRPEQLESLVRRTIERLGRIDILINSAGLGLQGDVAELRSGQMHYLFEVNLFGPVHVLQLVVPFMQQQGSGVIVNVSSILGRVTLPSLGMVGSSAAYTASKRALDAFSTAARMELADDDIHVITVMPGVTRTAFNENFMISVGSGTHKVRRTHSLLGITSAERVGARIVRAIERREREVYVSLKDRGFVVAANLAPGLFEWAMIRFRRSRIGR